MIPTSDHSSASARDARIVRRYFIIFFLVLVAVQAVLITLATRTHRGLVTDHPYEKGLAYNEVVQAAAQQEALGWKDELTFSNGKTSQGVLRFLLRDASGVLLKPQSVTVQAMRPTQEGMDFTADMALDPSGKAQANVTFPVTGLWDLRVIATVDGQPYQQSKRVVVE